MPDEPLLTAHELAWALLTAGVDLPLAAPLYVAASDDEVAVVTDRSLLPAFAALRNLRPHTGLRRLELGDATPLEDARAALAALAPALEAADDLRRQQWAWEQAFIHAVIVREVEAGRSPALGAQVRLNDRWAYEGTVSKLEVKWPEEAVRSVQVRLRQFQRSVTVRPDEVTLGWRSERA